MEIDELTIYVKTNPKKCEYDFMPSETGKTVIDFEVGSRYLFSY